MELNKGEAPTLSSITLVLMSTGAWAWQVAQSSTGILNACRVSLDVLAYKKENRLESILKEIVQSDLVFSPASNQRISSTLWILFRL